VESFPPLEPSIPRFYFEVSGYRFFPERPSSDLPYAALAGIAYPSHFFAKLAELFAPPLITHAFPDHHLFHPWELEILKKTWKKRGIAYLVVTPKDAVKLPQTLGVPVFVAEPLYRPRDQHEEQRFRRFLFARLGL
jgi:tetraacyldisaccharide-1-P 4'-kinase